MRRRNRIKLFLWSLVIATNLLGLNISKISAQMVDFADVPSSHWAADPINKWKNLNVISGVNHNFAPDQPLTRAQMAQIFSKLMGYNTKLINDFTDVSPSAWYFDAVQFAASAGTMVGLGGNTFSPNENITREQLMTAMAIAFDIQPIDTNADYPDISSVSTWALPYVNAMIEAGYISGIDGEIRPKAPATRAQTITIIDNMVAAYANQPITISGNIEGNVILNADGSSVSDAIINGNLIVAEGVGEGGVTLNNVMITGKLIVRGGGPKSVHVNGNSLFVEVGGTNLESIVAQFRGSAIGTTRVVLSPNPANTLTYQVSDTAISIPAVGSPASGTAYISGHDIPAAVGQYLAIYEVDAASNIVNTFTTQLIEANLSKLYVRGGLVNGTTAVFGRPTEGNTLMYALSDTEIPSAAIGSSTPILANNDAAAFDYNIHVAVGQYLAIYEIDAAGKIIHLFTKKLTEADITTPDVHKGFGMNATRVVAVTAPGNTLKYQISNSMIQTSEPGSIAPGINYESGHDIEVTVGQYLAIYEVDAANKVVHFYTKQLVADEINVPEVYSSSGMGTIQLFAIPAPGNTINYQLSNSIISTPLIGSKSPGIAYEPGDDISATVGQYLAIYEVDATGKVVNFYTKQLVAGEVNIPQVYAGFGMGTLQFSADISAGNTINYQLSRAPIPLPARGSIAPGKTYEVGHDIQATVGQYLAIYEVDTTGMIVNSYMKQLLEDEINIPEVFGGSDLGTIQFFVDPEPVAGNSLQYLISNDAIPTPVIGSKAQGKKYNPDHDLLATVGQYLGIYEVDAAGMVVNFYTKQLVADDINMLEDDEETDDSSK